MIYKLKQIMAITVLTIGTTVGAYSIELQTSGLEWKAIASTYTVTSKNGYINSITVGGKEFLAQENVPGGSYVCAEIIPPLKNITQEQNNIVSGSNSLAKIAYTFSDAGIFVRCENTSTKEILYYFVINRDIRAVRINGQDTKKTPIREPVSCVEWICDPMGLEFKANALIWGPWNNFQVWQVTIPAGNTTTFEIIPETSMDGK